MPGDMGRRSYQQYCPAARTLDVVGERWTLLLVRELLLGPRRYSDLLEALPGVGTNLLAERLRQLEAEGLVRRRRLPPPAGSAVYELTELGEELEDVVFSLARFGMRTLGRRRRGETFRPEWLVLALRGFANPEAARGVHESYEIRVDGAPLWVRVDDGSIETRPGPAPEPDVVLEVKAADFVRLGTGELSPAEAARTGAVRIEGDPAALSRFVDILGVEQRAAA
jgi:DNA-binding HxlR family transcriptional regulator